MPFRSEKQRRYLWKNHPKIARDWTDTYGSKPQPKKKVEGGSVKKVGPEKGTMQAKLDAALETYKSLTDKQRKELGLPPRERKGKSPSYSKGKEKAKEHKEKIKKLGNKALGYVDGWLGKKKGGRIKKNGPVRPIHIPWDSQKKKRGGTVHPRNQGVAVPKKGLGSLIPRLAEKVYGNKKAGGLARRPKRDKHNPHMEPYHGSYISGKVDGKMLSNPSLRKYYKGLI